eukprot:4106-Heterococcus_DN1.PRE.2
MRVRLPTSSASAVASCIENLCWRLQACIDSSCVSACWMSIDADAAVLIGTTLDSVCLVLRAGATTALYTKRFTGDVDTQIVRGA